MTFLELKKELADRFSSAGFDAADLEALYIVCEAAGFPEREFALHVHEQLASEVRIRAESFLARRLENEPWQYIFGHAPFRDLELEVGPGCLIPRPETEYSIDLMLDGLPKGASVCELGVGSGAISLALASERPDLTVVGTELSPDALKWAERNLKKLGLTNVTFLQGDLFEPVAGRGFDLVAANLPYIPEGDRNKLPANVRDYEPAEALFSGAAMGGSVPTTEIDPFELEAENRLLAWVAKVGLCKSNKEARQTMAAGGLLVNDEKITDTEYRITPEMLEGEGLLIRKGKKSYHRLVKKG